MAFVHELKDLDPWKCILEARLETQHPYPCLRMRMISLETHLFNWILVDGRRLFCLKKIANKEVWTNGSLRSLDYAPWHSCMYWRTLILEDAMLVPSRFEDALTHRIASKPNVETDSPKAFLIISQGKWSITQGSCTFSNYFNQQNPPSSTQQGEIHKVRNLKVILPMVAEEAYHRPKQYTVGLSPLHFRPWLLRLYFCTWLLWSQVQIYECLNFPHTAACLHSQTRSWDDQSDW